MNKTEEKAERWLQAQEEVSSFQSRKNPDFVCESGDGYEVKLLRNNSIVFTLKQFGDLERFKNPLKILVFNGGVKPLFIIPFGEIAKQPDYWRHIRIIVYDFSGQLCVRNIDPELFKFAKLQALTERKTLGQWFNELLEAKFQIEQNNGRK